MGDSSLLICGSQLRIHLTTSHGKLYLTQALINFCFFLFWHYHPLLLLFSLERFTLAAMHRRNGLFKSNLQPSRYSDTLVGPMPRRPHYHGCNIFYYFHFPTTVDKVWRWVTSLYTLFIFSWVFIYYYSTTIV